jgi:uncharacterized protein YutE (UPF0331/DUF86 family)
VVFTNWEKHPLTRRLRPEELVLEWQQECALPDGRLSVVDLSIAPVPLGWSILSEGRLLLDKWPDRRMRAEQRIYSMWELDSVHPQQGTTSIDNNGYLSAQQEHLDQCELDLAELQRRLSQAPWSRFEQRAAERTLQLLIKSCIGIAKQWSKQVTGKASNEALTAFNRLTDRQLIQVQIPWRKVVGLRNALVHDYLEVDPDIIRDVIASNYHQPLLEFARQGLIALGSVRSEASQ